MTDCEQDFIRKIDEEVCNTKLVIRFRIIVARYINISVLERIVTS